MQNRLWVLKVVIGKKALGKQKSFDIFIIKIQESKLGKKKNYRKKYKRDNCSTFEGIDQGYVGKIKIHNWGILGLRDIFLVPVQLLG